MSGIETKLNSETRGRERELERRRRTGGRRKVKGRSGWTMRERGVCEADDRKRRYEKQKGSGRKGARRSICGEKLRWLGSTVRKISLGEGN